MASRDELLKPAARRYRDVVLPFKGNVRIQSLNELERSEWEADSVGRNADPAAVVKMKATLAVLCVVDDQGNKLFTREDVSAILEWDSADSSKLFTAMAEHIGVTEADYEELAKNSNGTAAAT